MPLRPVSLMLLLLGTMVATAGAQSRAVQPTVVPPGPAAIKWTPVATAQFVVGPYQVCASSWITGICPVDDEIVVMMAPLIGVKGNLTACNDSGGNSWYWCTWRTVKVGMSSNLVSTATGKKHVAVTATQWLMSLPVGEQLIARDLPNELWTNQDEMDHALFVAKAVGSLIDSSRTASRLTRTASYAPTRTGPVSSRSAAPKFADPERGSFSIESLLAESPRSPRRWLGVAEQEGTRLDLADRRFLIVEGGRLRLKQGTTTLESWPKFPYSYIVRYPDRTVEVQTIFAKYK